jgi:hypothetical protein
MEKNNAKIPFVSAEVFQAPNNDSLSEIHKSVLPVIELGLSFLATQGLL